MFTDPDMLDLNDKYPALAKYTDPMKAAAREIVGRDKEILQLMAAMRRPELSNTVLVAEAGTGKALANDTLIPVDDERGYVCIDQLTMQDRVFNEFGFPIKLEGIFPQGYQQAFQFTVEDGSTIICNDEHLWATRSAQDCIDSVPYRVMTTREIMDEGLFDEEGQPKWFIPGNYALDREAQGLPYDAYQVGTNLGYDIDQRIPFAYLMGSIEQRSDLLAGIIKSPLRHLEYPRAFGLDDIEQEIALRTPQKALVDDLCELTTSLGYRPRVSVEMSYDDEVLEWYVVRFFYYTTMPKDQAIVSIIDLGCEVPMTCIKVASAKGLFQAGKEHLVTHNTALVQGAMLHDAHRLYLELDPARLISGVSFTEEIGALLKEVFDEAERFGQSEDRELVLFIDEFHQLVQMSDSAVEALKPVLAASGARGIRVIGATTYDEFHKYLMPNQPLMERLQRINLGEPDRKTTISILKAMAKRYDVFDAIPNDALFEQIYENTNKYVPRSSQPRKSILVLDAMVGWHRATGRSMDQKLLADVMLESYNINVSFRVDATTIEDRLNKRVIAQRLAVKTLADQLQVCVAGLNDPTRPMGSFLFTGSSGVGKTELSKALAQLLFGDAQRNLIRFDMSEFSQEDSVERFRREISKAVWERPFSVILLDEIEKAAKNCTRLLLQVLDDGRLTDENNKQVSFLNAYIILTTNAGAEVYENISRYSIDDNGEGSGVAEYLSNIRASLMDTSQSFPPELLGRINRIVPFQPLSRNAQERIVKRKLTELHQQMQRQHNVKMEVDATVMQYLIDDHRQNSSNEGGARTAIGVLNAEVTTAVATFINQNPDVRAIAVKIEGTMRSNDKNLLKGTARVVVSRR